MTNSPCNDTLILLDSRMGGGPSRAAGDSNIECPYCRERYFFPLFWGWHHHHHDLHHTHNENNGNHERIDPLRFLGDDIAVTQDEINQANKAVTEFFENLPLHLMKELPYNFVTVLAKSRYYRIHESLEVSDKVNLMIEFAKMGDFHKALRVLNEYPCIMNYILANRAWGIIHQAAYFNDYETMEIILNNPKCDPFLRTKRTLDGVVVAGSTADVIAKDDKVKKLITEDQKVKRVELQKRTRKTLLTIQSED